MDMLNEAALALVIIGALNWGFIGPVNFDLVAAIFGDGAMLARLVYVLVALPGLYQVRNLISARATTL